MIIAASIIYFQEDHYDDLIKLINQHKNIEITNEDKENGKMVVTIEAENNKDIEDLEEIFHNCDFIIDFTHHAFYFGDEVEKAALTGVIPDFDIKKPFTKKRIL